MKPIKQIRSKSSNELLLLIKDNDGYSILKGYCIIQFFEKYQGAFNSEELIDMGHALIVEGIKLR